MLTKIDFFTQHNYFHPQHLTYMRDETTLEIEFCRNELKALKTMLLEKLLEEKNLANDAMLISLLNKEINDLACDLQILREVPADSLPPVLQITNSET